MFDYIGEIQYGDFKNSNWYGNFTDKNDPRITNHIAKIMSKPEMFEGLNLHIVGGLLEGWGTWDIDWALSGSFNKAQVKKAIDWITKIGFEDGIYPDVTYSSKGVFDLHEWQKTGVCVNRWIYRYHNEFIKENEKTEYPLYIKDSGTGLYLVFEECPFPKNIEMDKKGHKYKKPWKIK